MLHRGLRRALIASLTVFSLALTATPAYGVNDEISDVPPIEEGDHLLEEQPLGMCGLSTFMQESAAATYHSLVNRINGHGMAPTSLTGLYPDGLMYMRDASAQVLTMLAAGDAERALPLLRYIIQYPLAAGFTRDKDLTLPHRIPSMAHVRTATRQNITQSWVRSHESGVLVASLPSDIAGPSGQLTKIELPLSHATGFTGELQLRVLSHADTPMQVATTLIDLTSSSRWVTFELSPPGYAAGHAPENLTLVLSPKGTRESEIAHAIEQMTSEETSAALGSFVWHGTTNNLPGLRAYTADMRITDPLNGNDHYPLGSGNTWDEMDENMHVLYAWASYIETTQDTAFLAETWPTIERYLDFYLTRSLYWLAGTPDAHSNLLMNPRLDAVGYHDGVYDLVTNVFASATFDALTRISSDPVFGGGIPDSSSSTGLTWESIARSIDTGINEHLVVKHKGVPVYVPWLTPSKQPDLSVGSIWVSLAPIAIEWKGFQEDVMRNTLDRYHDENSFNFGGVRMLNARYAQGVVPHLNSGHGYTGQWILLKSLTWEMQFEKSTENIERLEQLALWVGNYFPSTQVPAPESWIVNYPREVPVRDGGNQEHSSWYVFGILQEFPDCAPHIATQAGGYTPPPRVGNYTPIPVDRYAGNDRTHTSTLAALGIYGSERPESVYVARGDNYADAIAGGALTDGPILLLPGKQGLNENLLTALRELNPRRVVALGGTGVVSNETLKQAGQVAGAKTARLAGADRFATSAAIARESFRQAAAEGTPHTTVYLADGLGSDGRGSPDAVSAGALTDGATLLINPKSRTLPEATRQALADLRPTRVIALGGTAVVSDRLLSQAQSASGAKERSRLAGNDRYYTSAAIAKHAARFHAREVIIVRGDELADSVTAGGLNRGPILLTQSHTVPPVISAEVKRLRPVKMTVLGGTAVVHQQVASRIATDAVRPG